MFGVSVAIPLYNEEDNVQPLYLELTEVMSSMDCDYELIFVDDGSKDRTVKNMIRTVGEDPHVKIIEFRRNFGQTAAMAAGLDHASHEIVVLMDGDLQNDPKEIPTMIEKLSEGYDMVAGWRKNRQDKMLSRKLPSKIANWVISKSTKVQLHDYGCSLKVMTREVAKGIRLYGEMHRFIPALADEMGARIAEVPVNHRARRFGESKYGISRTLRVILDLMVIKFFLGFAKRPIHLFGSVGLGAGFLGAALLSWATMQKIVFSVPMGNRPILALGVMLVLIGLQFVVFGLLAEVLARTYYESQNKRTYTVRNYYEPGKIVQSQTTDSLEAVMRDNERKFGTSRN